MEYIVYFLASFSGVIIVFLAVNGFFKPVLFSKAQKEEFVFIYRTFLGDYKNVSNVQNLLLEDIHSSKINVQQTMGIYYDNPKEVKSEELRAVVGVIVAQKEITKVINHDLHIGLFPKVTAIATTFTYKNPLSILLAILKVYPAFRKYAKGKNIGYGPVLEVYDMENEAIHFYFTQTEQEKLVSFYELAHNAI